MVRSKDGNKAMKLQPQERSKEGMLAYEINNVEKLLCRRNGMGWGELKKSNGRKF